MNATFVRPWYVLGPGHRWPMALIPFYRLLERLPGKRESAMRLGLVTIQEMAAALVWAVENPPSGLRIISVPEIRAAAALLRFGQDGGAAAPATAAR
jgi:nucleoside-diphosphate-sugar epimerase